MVTSDLMKFNTITKDGFLKYTAEMMKLGSELGLNVTKNLDAQSVKELLPHPSTISNHINKISERKDEIFPYAAHIQAPEEDFKRIINSEIDRYLLDASTYSTYLLGYWRNALNYPYLSYYAKFIFSIMASSSPIERSFSVLNKVDCKDRPQLGQETISNIVISNAVEQYLKVENV